jgi:microcystin-dependent protein
MFGGNFAPAGWMFCEGQLLPISENETLFNLIGTTYGGDGQSTFALPDLRGRIPLHQGNGSQLAETGGAETVTVTVPTMASHNHPFLASNGAATTSNPSTSVLAKPVASIYNAGTNPVAMNAGSITQTGNSQPHENMQPYLCVDFIISLFGLYPSPT